MGQRRDESETAASGRPMPLAGLRVLVIEDHAIGRALMEAMLGALEAEATLVGTGEEAREAMRDRTFDVVLVDLGLPDVPGEALARDLDRRCGVSAPPFVAVTGRARPAVLPTIFTDWLEKPYSVRDLHRLLSAFLVRPRRTA